MSNKRSIKVQVFCLAVLLVAFAGMSLYFFKKNHLEFKHEIYARASNNLKIIDALTKIDTHLYTHKKALSRYVGTAEPKWRAVMLEAQGDVESLFLFLEDFNKGEFQMWVPTADYVVSDPQGELEKQIIQFQKGHSGPEYFQRLFYLVRYNLKEYFAQSLLVPINDQEAHLRLVFTGLGQMFGVYNNMFWDFSQRQNLVYDRNTDYYFRAMIVLAVMSLFYGLFVTTRVLRQFNHLRQVQNDTLLMFGALDSTTNMFNRMSFELLAAREIERAKRRGQHLSLLLFQVGPCEQIKADLGQRALDRFLYEVGAALLKSCRAYDGVYKYDLSTFVLVMTETDLGAAKAVVARFSKKFKNMSFVLEGDGELQAIPQVSMGFANYPIDGVGVAELVQVAKGRLTADFDAYPVCQTSQPRLDDQPEVLAEKNPTPIQIDEAKIEHKIIMPAQALVGGQQAQAPHVAAEHEQIVVPQREPEIVPEPIANVVANLAVPEPEPIPEVVAALSQPEATSSTEIRIPNIGDDAVNDDGEDVITVDFDREPEDLAVRFRRKQRESKIRMQQVKAR